MSERHTIADRVLARLQKDRLPPFADGRPVTMRVLSVATRPFSYVMRIEIESSAARRRVFAKIPRLKPGKPDGRVARLEQEVAAARTLASTFKSEAGLSVPELVAFYREIPALVWAEVDGATLEAMAGRLARGVPSTAAISRLEDALHGAGRWLRVLQAATPVDRRELSLDEMTGYVDLRLKRIRQLGPRRLGPEWEAKVHRVFSEARLTSADRRLAAVHGDFSLSNIMYAGGWVVVIDFSRFGIGSIYYDVARLYHQLGLLQHKPWFLPLTVARLRRALLAGYDPDLRPDQPAFRLFLIQHLLCHWQGLLKTAASVSLPVRGFHRWVGYRHGRELDHLVDPGHADAPAGECVTP